VYTLLSIILCALGHSIPRNRKRNASINSPFYMSMNRPEEYYSLLFIESKKDKMIFVSRELQLEVGMHDIDRLIKTSDFFVK